MNLKQLMRQVPDFPKAGVNFIDITTVLKDPQALRYVVQKMAEHYANKNIDVVVGVESRGFIFGAPIAYELGLGFVLVRKPGKLPADKLRIEYDLEYGTDALEIHKDAIEPGKRVLLVDDLLATGGTISAAARLVEQLGGTVAGFAFLVELAFLNGRQHLGDHDILSLVSYEE